MPTIFDVDTQFEMQKLIELSMAEDLLEFYLFEKDEMEEDYNNLRGLELERLDEICGRDIPDAVNDIEKIETVIEYIQKIKKMKHSLVEHSLRIMYHPSRVARLVEQGVISFQDEKLWEL